MNFNPRERNSLSTKFSPSYTFHLQKMPKRHTTHTLAMTCWSDLASDVLEYITRFLPLTDYHRFSAVCKNWRVVAKQKRYSPTPQLPWLVLGEEPVTRKRIFYNLSENKHYSIDIPELYGCYICGSSHGWLVAIDINIMGILINPFTRDIYKLPLFPQYDIGRYDMKTPFKNVPTDYRKGYKGYTLDKLQVSVVHKAILSHDPKKKPDFTVMILTGLKGVPAFWKPGDSSWNVISVMKPRINDIIYLNHEQQFIFLTVQNEIFIVDFKHDIKVEKDSTIEIDIGAMERSYLVNYFGYLQFVVRCYQEVEKGHYRTNNFQVLTPDFNNEEEMDSLDSFRDDAIFLGRNDSISIDLSEIPGCNGNRNSIYFTDVAWRLSDEKFGWDDMGIFHMWKGTFERFYSHEIPYTPLGAPIWLTPNTW